MWGPKLPLQLVFVLAPLLIVFTYATSDDLALDYDLVNDIFFNPKGRRQARRAKRFIAPTTQPVPEEPPFGSGSGGSGCLLGSGDCEITPEPTTNRPTPGDYYNYTLMEFLCVVAFFAAPTVTPSS